MEIGDDNYRGSFFDWLETDAGKEHIDYVVMKHEIKEKRFNRFTEWLKNNDFDKLMYRLIFEHNQDYKEKCYHNGCEPYPNNKLAFLIEYVMNNCDLINVKQLENSFPNEIRFFKGYYFQVIWDKNTIVRIYNKKDLRLLLQI